MPTQEPPPERASSQEEASTPEAAPAPGRWRRLLYWAILAQLAGVALLLLLLLVGEQSRLTLVSLYLPRQPVLAVALAAALLAPLTRRRVKTLVGVQLVVLLIVLFPVMGLAVSTSRSSEGSIRVATYNVFFGKGGRAALIDEIVAMPADVIVLQATYDSLADRLRERMPERTVRKDAELVLVSRFPVRSVEVPPPLPGDVPAMFVKYVLDTPSGALRVYNVHPYSPRQALFDDRGTGDNIALREAQIGAAVAAARSDVPPFIVAGDTNLPALSAIGRRAFAGLTDAFADVGLGFGYTFPAKRPWMRIDRVLGGDGVRFTGVRVGPRGASDHRPLFVDLELVGR